MIIQKLNELEVDIEGRMDWKNAQEEFRKKRERLHTHVGLL